MALKLTKGLGHSTFGSAILFCDNHVVVALHIAAISVYHEHTKHIKLDCHLMHKGITCVFAESTSRNSDQASTS